MSQTKAQLLGPVLGDVNFDNNTLFVDNVNNRVGFGVSNPIQKVHIDGSALISNNNYYYAYSSVGNQTSLIGITSSNNIIIGQNNANHSNTYLYGGTGNIYLNTGNDNRLTVTPGGNIGIGNSNPQSKLDVNGTITGDLTGNVTGGLTVEQINASISDTAVDIFIYDTSKDSDGGAWRKRTTHTSWYNETLNTATRGSRREFPAVAVIVVTTNTITIYDGDDPDLPMWMKFTDGYNTYLGMGIGGLTSVSILNGVMVHGGQYDVHVTNFISDKTNRYGIGGITVNHTQPISGRNDDTAGNYNGPTTPNIVNRQVNDVAMTVLPNAPIDDTTGLPIPTIAVATNGGVSVIRDDGQVFDLTFSSQNGNKVWKITFDDNYQICMLLGYSNVYPYTSYIYHVPSSDTALSSVTDRVLNNSTYNFPSDAYGAANTSSGDINDYIDSKYFGTDKGMSFLTPNKNDIGGQLICHINTKFNSGWQHGNIKGAFLADTTVESLTANTNLATNATQFDTGRLTSETYDDGDTSWQMVDDAGTFNGYLNLRLNGLTIGQSYIISVTFDNNAALDAGYNHRIDHNNGTITNFTHWNKTNASSETLTGVFTATSQNGEEFVLYANAITLNVSNFIVRAVDDEDRSVNAKGLQVFGTVTKSPVATGAELVAYRGFNSNNYLRSPAQTNHPFSFGTGDFSLIFWAKITSTTPDRLWYSIGDYASSSNSIRMIQLNSSGNGDTSYFYCGSDYVASTSEDGLWHQWCFMRSNGVIFLYKDSVLQGSASSTVSITGPDTYGATIGTATQNGSPFAYGVDYMSLFRISASAPSAEQIKKIYEDEKVLFQENAACTLYGSSDAVTALAYDEVTERLHVGTSSGRSDFQGLRRINNTTTAVTTAISAHDGFIVEQ